MLSEEQIITLIKQVLPRWSENAIVSTICALTPDASLRRYFRVTFTTEPSRNLKSLIVMFFDSVACPEFGGGGPKVDSDDAFIELAQFFRKYGVRVPEIYYDGRENSLFFIEDLGDRQLASLLLPVDSPSKGRAATPQKEIEQAFFRAIDQILALQKIPEQGSCFAFQRGFNKQLYLKEMSEFIDFILKPLPTNGGAISIAEELFETLADELEAQPSVLAHRDFHAWNLLLSKNEVCVIDFQDALLAPQPYDLVSLLNDRDMDSLLGESSYRACIDYFFQKSGVRSEFYDEYDRTLLQRDLKVAGRFAKLVSVRKLTNYARWIPGTHRRIGSTLQRMTLASGCRPIYARALHEFCACVPHVSTGAEHPFLFQRD